MTYHDTSKILGKLVHVICMGDIDNLNETVGRLERSESIASIESVEVDRPLDQVISEVAEKETEIEMKSDEPDLESEIKPEPQEVTAENHSQEKMEVDQSEAETLPKMKEETVSNENVPMEEEQVFFFCIFFQEFSDHLVKLFRASQIKLF